MCLTIGIQDADRAFKHLQMLELNEMVHFGVFTPQEGITYESMRNTVLKCEEFGFESVWLLDHLHSFPRPEEPLLECWTTLSALAEATKHIRLGTMVLNSQYRNPAILAKMAATLDNISGGRLEFGIGAGGTGRAGWLEKIGYTPEYKAYGVDFTEKTLARISRLEEAVQIIEKLWTENTTTFKGQYYHVENAYCYPKPKQEPHPPIWVGGVGEKHLLKCVAKYANGCNLPWDLTPQECVEKIELIDDYCRDFGRSEGSIAKSLLTACVLGRTRDDVRDMIGNILTDYKGLEGYKPRVVARGAITGTPEECIRRISEFKDAGINYFMISFPKQEVENGIEEFARTIMPSFT